MLQNLTKLVASQLRGYDVLARFGGEEFVVLLPSTSSQVALEIAERIRRAAQEAVVDHADEVSVRLTLSIGISTAYGSKIDGGKLLENADQALYEAKRNGRNCCKSG